MTLPRPANIRLEFIFHGTGNSGSIPSIGCLTTKGSQQVCETCYLAMKPEGKKNFRRNTGGIFRINRPDGTKATIIVDVGKNFLASAIGNLSFHDAYVDELSHPEWFPKYGLRRIDGVLITHPHADALNGLDDLRGWTDSKQNIQQHIDVYASQDSYAYVQKAFPYLVSRDFASGGGDVPQFKWHIIEPNKPFVIDGAGLEVTPFSVHHGRLFANKPTQNGLPTPDSSHPSSPQMECLSQKSDMTTTGSEENSMPFYCLGFVILDVVYMSDVSYIPETAWQVIEKAKRRPYSLFIVDCLRLSPHTSHFGLSQAVVAARRLGDHDLRTYLVGFSHDVTHSKWEEIGKYLNSADGILPEPRDLVVKSALALVPKGPPIWVMPAYDGLRLFIDDKGKVLEDTY